MYMRAANHKPGDIYCIGFDTSPEVVKAFDQGFVQLTSDQQPFLQGYLPILSLCLQLKYGFAPAVQDTGEWIRRREELQERGRLGEQGAALGVSAQGTRSQAPGPAL